MTALDTAIWWVGLITVAAGTVGGVALAITWAVDSVLKFTGYSRALLEAYSRLQTEKMHERQTDGGQA